MSLLRALLVWLGILLAAVLNGGARETVLEYRLGSVLALVVSGLLLSLLIVAIALATVRWIGGPGRGWEIGALWLVLAVMFEFGFGAFVQHKSWEELLRPYTFAGGNLWPLVLLVLLLAPPLAKRLREGGGRSVR